MRKPAPGADATVPRKPRNLDESLHAHAADIAVRSLLCEATLCRPANGHLLQRRFDIACILAKMRRWLLFPKCGFLSGSVRRTAPSPGSCSLGRRARDIPFTSWINRAASCQAAVRGAVRKEVVVAKRKGNKEARKPKQQKAEKTGTGYVSELMVRAMMPGKRR